MCIYIDVIQVYKNINVEQMGISKFVIITSDKFIFFMLIRHIVKILHCRKLYMQFTIKSHVIHTPEAIWLFLSFSKMIGSTLHSRFDCRWYVPMKLAAWFKARNVENVYEMGWWESDGLPSSLNNGRPNLQFICTPAFHGSGREPGTEDKVHQTR